MKELKESRCNRKTAAKYNGCDLGKTNIVMSNRASDQTDDQVSALTSIILIAEIQTSCHPYSKSIHCKLVAQYSQCRHCMNLDLRSIILRLINRALTEDQ